VGTAGPRRAGGAGVLPTVGLSGTGAGVRGLPVPVGRYPRVGDHDGLQVEAPVAQIPAERGGRAAACGRQRCPPMSLWVSQAVARGDARSPSSRAGTRRQWAQPGLPVSAQSGEAAALGARRDAHAGVGRPGAAPSQRLVLDVAASISNRISSQQLHFKAFHSAALME